MAVFARRERRALGDVGNPLIPSRPDARTTANVMVTADSAMTLASVWACVRIRADIVSTLPLRPFAEHGGVLKPMTGATWIDSPSGDGMSTEEWLYATQMSLDLRGNAFGIITRRDGLGYPLQIDLVHPDLVVVRRAFDGTYDYTIGGKPYAANDVYHERQFVAPGSLLGMSPIGYAARSMGTALAAEKFGADWFADGAHPSSVLYSDQRINESDAKTIKQRFMEAVRGTREPVVMGLGLKYQAIQVAPNESQFIEAMRWGVQQVCRVYGVPPEMVGAESGNSMTYANVEQRAIDFLTYGIGPTLIRRERALSRLMPSRQQVRYDLKALLRSDTETRFKSHAIGIAAKFMLPDEARKEEDMPPLTDDEKALLDLVPLIVTPSGIPKAVQTPATPPPDANA